MATFTRQPQALVNYIAAGNAIPDFLAGHIQDFLAAHDITADVSVAPDGTITIETDATGQDLTDALDGITPDDINPDGPKNQAHQGIMAQLDAFADAVEAGTPPTAAQTQAAVARLVRVVQYVAARR